MKHTLVIRELSFSAAHYLPGHPKCGVIHGHTYFVRNLEITYDDAKGFVDFHDIQNVINGWDHVLIIPQDHFDMFQKADLIERKMICLRQLAGVPTVENIGRHIKWELETLPGVAKIIFELYEGPNQGVKI